MTAAETFSSHISVSCGEASNTQSQDTSTTIGRNSLEGRGRLYVGDDVIAVDDVRSAVVSFLLKTFKIVIIQ